MPRAKRKRLRTDTGSMLLKKKMIVYNDPGLKFPFWDRIH
jgi:hypothetical protein